MELNSRQMRQQYIFASYEDLTVKHLRGVKSGEDVEDILWALGHIIGYSIASADNADVKTYHQFLPLIKRSIEVSTEEYLKDKRWK